MNLHSLIVRASVLSSLATSLMTAAQAQIAFEVKPSLAPNAFGSPYYLDYAANAVHAIRNGLHQYGDHDLPSYYDALPVNKIRARDMCVTSFNSWRGKVDPGTLFGPQYAAEYGNRLHFGVRITGNGQKISIAMLSFEGFSDDPDNYLGFAFGTGEYNYSTQYMGLDYGPDGIRGTGDDVEVTSGDNTQLVDEIIGRGSGNAFWPGMGTTDNTQATIDNFIATLPKKIVFTGTYRLTSNGNLIGMGTTSVEIRR